LQHNRADIGATQQHNGTIAAVLDDIVDDAALQFERYDFEEKNGNGQQQQRELVLPAGSECN
jgi:hypothetical protein